MGLANVEAVDSAAVDAADGGGRPRRRGWVGVAPTAVGLAVGGAIVCVVGESDVWRRVLLSALSAAPSGVAAASAVTVNVVRRVQTAAAAVDHRRGTPRTSDTPCVVRGRHTQGALSTAAGLDKSQEATVPEAGWKKDTSTAGPDAWTTSARVASVCEPQRPRRHPSTATIAPPAGRQQSPYGCLHVDARGLPTARAVLAATLDGRGGGRTDPPSPPLAVQCPPRRAAEAGKDDAAEPPPPPRRRVPVPNRRFSRHGAPPIGRRRGGGGGGTHRQPRVAERRPPATRGGGGAS